jgi:hypothetical protein
VRNMAHGVFPADAGGLEIQLALHTATAPTWLEWQPYLDQLRAHCDAANWDLARVGSLVVTDGGAPSTEQRTAANNLIVQGRTLPRVAVVTDAPVVRTLLRGVAIFNSNMRVFAPAEFAEALGFLGVDARRAAEALDALARMEREQLGAGRVKTLGALRGAAR